MDSIATPQFIGAYFIEDIGVCDRLIQYHTQRKQFAKKVFDPSIKDSVDISIEQDDLADYANLLMGCVAQYVNEYPMVGGKSRWGITETVGIQHYLPGGGYKTWHTERQGLQTADRHLVFMTYLNNVQDGGTEFYHQNFTAPAIKGLTLIWPSDWTFTHRSQVSNSYEKYVVTGWFNFVG